MSPGEFGPPSTNSATLPHRGNRLSDSNNFGNFDKIAPSSSDDFIGAPFDGAAVLDRLDHNQSPNRPLSMQRQNVPPPLKSEHKSFTSPSLKSSSTFSKMDTAVDRSSPALRGTDSPPLGTIKRFSDDGKDLKSSMLRKKTGLSGFVNSLVGSPKKPAISAPENPVHVTHVGYDSLTGQFTVCRKVFVRESWD